MTPFSIGGKLILDGRDVYVEGSTLVVVRADGSVSPFPQASPAAAQTAADVIGQIQVGALSFVMYSVGPTVFAPQTDTVIIKGANFKPTSTYTLYLDNEGLLDYNGWYMTCTYVDSQTLRAVWGGQGDNIMDNPIAVVIKNDAGTISNVLLASFDGTYITMNL